jgi:hypothetical protein
MSKTPLETGNRESLLLACLRQLTSDKLVSGELLIPLTPDRQTALGRLPCDGGISGATVKSGDGGVNIGEFLCVAEPRFGAGVERGEFGDQFFIKFDTAAWAVGSRLEIGLARSAPAASDCGSIPGAG